MDLETLNSQSSVELHVELHCRFLSLKRKCNMAAEARILWVKRHILTEHCRQCCLRVNYICC